jgi:CRP-like cAMP-binding protein
MADNPIPQPTANRILASLPGLNRKVLNALEPVFLRSGTVLCEPARAVDYVYFLADALVSVICAGADGSTLEVSLVGGEGLIGLPAVLGGPNSFQAIVQMSGRAFRMESGRLLAEFNKNEDLRNRLMNYTNSFLVQIAQLSICNCYHSLQERLCRWLLVARDATRSNSLTMTHETISRLLGARRAGITVAVGLLEKAGLLRRGRGQIVILDPSGLEEAACECYSVLRECARMPAPS